MSVKFLTNLLFEPKGMHNQNAVYNIKDTVMSGDGSRVYFAIQDVPAGIPLNDSNYWKLQIDLSGSKSAMDQALASFGNYAKEIGMRVRGETAKASGNPVTFLPDAGSLLQPVTALEPQQQGSGDPSPSNIRPFIGYDKLGLGVRGKNIFPAWSESSYTMNGVTFTKQADGSIRAQGTPTAYAYIVLTDYKTLREHGFAEGVYTISGLPEASDAWFVDLIGDVNSQNINFYQNSTFNVSAELSRGGTYAWRIVITPNAGMIDLTFRIQVEAGSESSSFAPYHDKLYTVKIGQTVYGFHYGWLTGKLMAEWAVKAFDGTENGWVVQRFNNLVAYCPVYDMMLMPRYLTSSHFKSYENISGAPNGTIGIAQEGISAGLEGAFFGIEGIASTVDEWKSFLAAQFAAGTPVQITYKLKTPIEIQLSPTSISAADPEQTNTLYGDGSIEVEYVKPLHASIGGGSAPVQSVNGKTGNVQLSASDVGAASKDDVDKLSEEIANKVTNDFGTENAWLPVVVGADGKLTVIAEESGEETLIPVSPELTYPNTSCYMPAGSNKFYYSNSDYTNVAVYALAAGKMYTFIGDAFNAKFDVYALATTLFAKPDSGYGSGVAYTDNKVETQTGEHEYKITPDADCYLYLQTNLARDQDNNVCQVVAGTKQEDKKYPLYTVASDGSDIEISYPYGDDVLTVRLNKRGGNNLFDFRSIKTNSETLFDALLSDWHSPFVVAAVNNADGDAPTNQYFTGGSHQTNNQNSGGAKTARTSVLAFYADGKILAAGDSGHADRIEMRWTNLVQGYNTTKADGSGREILRENHTLTFVNGKFVAYVEIIPLEAVTMKTYYGLQAIMGSKYPNIRYPGGANRAEYTEASECGDLTTYCMDCYGDNHRMRIEIDPLFDLGKRTDTFTNGTKAAFSTDYGKCYFTIVNKDVSMAAGDMYCLRGSYEFMPR